MSPYRNVGGLEYAFASDLVGKPAKPLTAENKSPIARAIGRRWPESKPIYQMMIFRRFTELYASLPETDAVCAIRAGFSSPRAAMRARVIPKRRYIGFAP